MYTFNVTYPSTLFPALIDWSVTLAVESGLEIVFPSSSATTNDKSYFLATYLA
jgi:hypothetical protein